jgi:hypothetical protein
MMSRAAPSEVMKPSMVAPELRRALRRIPSMPLHWRWARRLGRLAIRRMPAAQVPGVTREQPAGAMARDLIATAQSWLRRVLIDEPRQLPTGRDLREPEQPPPSARPEAGPDQTVHHSPTCPSAVILPTRQAR